MLCVSENQKYHEKIPTNIYAAPLICNPLKDQVFDIEDIVLSI